MVIKSQLFKVKYKMWKRKSELDPFSHITTVVALTQFDASKHVESLYSKDEIQVIDVEAISAVIHFSNSVKESFKTLNETKETKDPESNNEEFV